MSQSFSSAALVGCTGLVGSNILAILLDLPTKPTVHALTRRDLPHKASNLNTILEKESSSWPPKLQSLAPPPKVFITAMGTTKAQAGSVEAQRKIDYDLNIALAKAAKINGTEVLVLMSSAGTSANSSLPYSKMKGELEEAVKEIGFAHTVILRPGVLVGPRTESRPAEAIVRRLASCLGAISTQLTDFWAQDARVIGRAAVAAAVQCASGQREEGIWMVDQSEIVRLGRTEWKEG